MSWLYSRALVEAYSAENSSAGAPSAQSSLNPTPRAYLSPDKMTDFSRLSRFGMTFGHLTDDLGADVLTWFLAGFPVKRTPPLLLEKIQRTTYGRRCGESWQMSLPGLSLPRTSADERLSDLQSISRLWVTKPKRYHLARKTWVLTTFGKDTGYVHTPTTKANYSAKSMQKWPSARAFVMVFGKPTPENQEWLMGFPLGWTDLKPLAMARFRNAPRLLGLFSRNSR